METVRENLELFDVEYDQTGKKATLTFLDREYKMVRLVSFNKQSYQDGKYVDDPEKAENVEGWCKQYFNCTFDQLPTVKGVLCTVYCYDTFNSLWKSDSVKKFDKSMCGSVFQTAVKSITMDDTAIRVRYEIDGETYESKYTFAKYLEQMKQWFVDPLKKEKSLKKFEETYGVPVEQADSLIGHPLMVEVRSCFGDNYYGEVKKFPAKKNKK